MDRPAMPANGTDRPAPPLLDVQGLVVRYPAGGGRGGVVHAVRGVDLAVERGETLGLVGESGCGKSTLARALVRLAPVAEGAVRLAGEDVLAAGGRDLKRIRRSMQLVLQDPSGSLDPRMTVGDAVAEPLEIHRWQDRAARSGRVGELLERVGLGAGVAGRYPHELSGGQRQRIGIARALALQPRLLICDEPVSALDVSTQAQVINLLSDLKSAFGLTYLFIAHDLAVVRQVSDRMAVMYLGRIVEVGGAVELCAAPRHPYTAALIEAAGGRCRVGGTAAAPPFPAGEPPSPVAPPPGCAYHPRCPFADEPCRRDLPLLRPLGDRRIACHHAERIADAPLASSRRRAGPG